MIFFKVLGKGITNSQAIKKRHDNAKIPEKKKKEAIYTT